MKRQHIIVEGQVQSRGFRDTCWKAAKKLKLTGWVKNLVDGRVELELQGDEQSLARFLPRIHQLNSLIDARVQLLETIDINEGETRFRVL